MQNDISQLVQNPRLLASVLNAPSIQPLMDSLAANSDISRQMIENNPMFANNPEVREQMINALPAMMEQMRNREALEAITQVQESEHPAQPLLNDDDTPLLRTSFKHQSIDRRTSSIEDSLSLVVV